MTINGNKYKIPELTFNSMCELEDMGIALTTLDKKPMATIRGFIALAVGDTDKAGKELEAHITSGGKLDEILEEIQKAVSESGFFRSLAAGQTQKTPTGESK